jgi:glycosyltransferase involved in cell wall biosynthesis
MNYPEISVLMTVYNGGIYVKDAYESIMSQDFINFEFIIVDDGSQDKALDFLENIIDERVKLHRIKNSGLVEALNYGLKQCKGKYIARMDADDISLVSRLRIQKEFLDQNVDVDIVCSNINVIDEQGKIVSEQIQSWNNQSDLLRGLLMETDFKPIIHPSVMVKRDVYNFLNGYRNLKYAEDRDLWLRASLNFKIFRLQDKLLNYRIHSKGISREKVFEQMASSVMTTVNFRVKRSINLDIYENHFSLFREKHIEILNFIKKDISKTYLNFIKLKKLFREKKFFLFFLLYIILIIKNFEIITNSSVRKKLLYISKKQAESIEIILSKEE